VLWQGRVAARPHIWAAQQRTPYLDRIAGAFDCAPMTLSWSKLVRIRESILIAELGVPLGTPVAALPLIGESPFSTADCRLQFWFKMADHLFLHTTGPLIAS